MSILGKHHSKLVSTGQMLRQALCTIASARSPAFPVLLEVGQKVVFYSLLTTLSKVTNSFLHIRQSLHECLLNRKLFPNLIIIKHTQPLNNSAYIKCKRKQKKKQTQPQLAIKNLACQAKYFAEPPNTVLG